MTVTDINEPATTASAPVATKIALVATVCIMVAVIDFSFVYAGAMLVRYAVRMYRQPRERWFGGAIPITSGLEQLIAAPRALDQRGYPNANGEYPGLYFAGPQRPRADSSSRPVAARTNLARPSTGILPALVRPDMTHNSTTEAQPYHRCLFAAVDRCDQTRNFPSHSNGVPFGASTRRGSSWPPIQQGKSFSSVQGKVRRNDFLPMHSSTHRMAWRCSTATDGLHRQA